MEYSENIVLRVNELYHDLEGEGYHLKHEDIFIGDKDYWGEFISKYVDRSEDENRVFLDIGTGSGFVPLLVGRSLKLGDIFYCSDISRNILDAAKNNIEKQGSKNEFRYLKVDGRSIDLPDATVDFVTINSVLHHIPVFEGFFQEINRVLKPGGRIVVGHEPNRAFFLNRLLWGNFVTIFLLLNPATTMYLLLDRVGLVPFVKKLFRMKTQQAGNEYAQMVASINEKLHEEGMINEPLSIEEISKIIDFHSPTAGQKANRFNQEKGIDMLALITECLPGYKVESYETYNHLFRISHKNWLLRGYSTILKRVYPNAGAAFFSVVRKSQRG